MRGTKAAKGAKVVVGTRVYCMLYGGRYGIVYKVHGEQAPDTIGSMSGAVSYGGRAEFDIAFDNHLSRRVPECVVRGVQWDIYDEVAPADEIVELISKANASVAAAEAEAAAASVRRAAERVKHLADNPHLTPVKDKPNWSPGRLAATNIRKELKAAFPTVKFSVTSEYDSVRVNWTDGPTVKMVEAVTGKYQSGSFDGMNDIYESNADATFADVFGGPKYVSESRDDTLEGMRYAWVNGKAVNEAGNPSCGWGPADDLTEKWYLDRRADEFRRTWSATDLTNVKLPAPAEAA